MVHLTSVPLFNLLALVAAVPFDGNLRNGMISRQAGADCKAMVVIFARGTTEPPPIGLIAGPPLQDALEAQMGAGNVDFQGVDYPADVAGFLAGGDAGGSKDMAQMVTQAVADCPDSDVVMVGYRYVHPCDHVFSYSSQLMSGTVREGSSSTMLRSNWTPPPRPRSRRPSSLATQTTRTPSPRSRTRRSSAPTATSFARARPSFWRRT